MNCPKCGNELREDMFCDNCKEYLFNMDKPKKGDAAKSWIKFFGITLFCCALFACIVVGVIEIGEKREYQKEMMAQYERTYQDFLDEKYYSVITDINEFKNSSDSKDEDMQKKYNELYQQTEEAMYGKIFLESDNENAESLCRNYIEYFPNNSHITEVNKKYSEILNTLAPIRISEARKNISEGEYLEADRILGSIVGNDKISTQYVNEAKTIKDSISEIVKYETPIYVSIQDLLSDATYYNNRKVNLTTNVIVTAVDRERKMLLVCPVSDNSSLGYDYSFSLEIYYGTLSNQSKWGSISSNDDVELNYVSGRFKIYANRSNSGYIEAESIN